MAFTLKGCVRHPDVSTQEALRLQDVSIQEVVGHLDVSTGLHSGACKTQDVSTHDVKHPVVSTREVVSYQDVSTREVVRSKTCPLGKL